VSGHFLSRRKFIETGVLGSSALAILKMPARAAQFEFKAAGNTALNHPLTTYQQKMWAAIEQESGGRIHVQYFPNSQLGSEAAMFSQLRVGAIDFVLQSGGITSSVVPTADIGFLGFTFKDADEGIRTMNGAVGDYVRTDAASKGLYLLRSCWDTGMANISSGTHPILVPDDLRGFRIRVVETKIQLDLFKALGANPIPLAVAEMYTAMQTKLLDGGSVGLVSLEASKWYEVQKYISLTNHTFSPLWTTANGDTWKRLPPDLQNIIERNNTTFAQMEQRDAKQSFAALITKITQQGLTFNNVDQIPFRKPLQSYYESWAKVYGPAVWALLERSVGHKVA
jgi:TRAP-type transport system periplasmic protein